MANQKQHTHPIYIDRSGENETIQALEPIAFGVSEHDDEKYDEDWIQNLIQEHPALLPVEEIEPAFFPLYPVCRELKSDAGYLDNLFVSETGALTLVECKLWRNPEARREVVGQVLDYAKEISRWSYEDLDEAIRTTTGQKGNVLYEAVAKVNDELDEARFVDAVSRNLQRGRFLMLIVGDGIREGVENIANFLQRHAGMDFTFGLVELAFYRFPEGRGLLVQPRVIAQTVSIERAVVRVEGFGVVVEEPKDQVVSHKAAGRKSSLSEKQFYEVLAEVDPTVGQDLSSFMERLGELDVTPSYGSISLNLRWFPDGQLKMNFGSIQTTGTVQTNVSLWTLQQIGREDIAHRYQTNLAAILPGAQVSPKWTVLKEGKAVPLRDLLDVQEQWMEVIKETQRELTDALSH